MKGRTRWLDKLADGLDLPGENPSGQPVVELAGDTRVLIEHHKGVVEYGTEQICVKVAYGTVKILGSGLELARMTKNQLVITGQIDSVVLFRRNAHDVF